MTLENVRYRDGDQSTEGILKYKKPLELFAEKEVVKICAPMVRYSKLSFRSLVRKYNCDLAFTPMIIADSFVRSAKARDSEFTTNSRVHRVCLEHTVSYTSDDRPLIVQFASNNPKDFANAAEIVSPFSDGVDLNCGCPQRWALQEGYGACLIRKPELLKDITHQAKSRISDPDFTISVKIRVHKDLRKTVDMCQQVEKTGISWITVHGRTTDQRNQPVNWEAIKLIKDSVSIPVIANGDIRNMKDVDLVQEKTGVNGVMAARGILANPAMYAGYDVTPLQCVQDWLTISSALGTQFQCFHHHLISMMESITSKSEKRVFNSLGSTTAVLDFLHEYYGI